MKMQAEWIKLDPDRLDKPMRVRLRDTEVEVRVSPYDLPEAIRGYWSLNHRRFTIEFRYLAGEEPLAMLSEIDFLTPYVGRHSKRLYRLDIDMEKMRAAIPARPTKSDLQLADAFASFNRFAGGRYNRFANYEAAREAISEVPGLVPQ
jgi:hypothetical protein